MSGSTRSVLPRDDGRLDDPEALKAADQQLRWLAGSGARVRLESGGAAEVIGALSGDGVPRAIVAAGALRWAQCPEVSMTSNREPGTCSWT